MLERLKTLRPEQFENLVFDLVRDAGLRNTQWRTPGADGGRDIQGVFSFEDLSGTRTWNRWYVECKRYSSSLSWPTVREKVAYAENHEADYLLLVTTAHLSPQCQSEVDSWNTSTRYPKIRAWDAATLPSVLERHPQVHFKYRLTSKKDSESLRKGSMGTLVRETLKCLQAAHGTAITEGQQNWELQASAAMAELLTVQMEAHERGRDLVFSPCRATLDVFSWVEPVGEVSYEKFDRYGLRALFCVVRILTGDQTLILSEDGTNGLRIATSGTIDRDSAVRLLDSIALWGDFDLRVRDEAICIGARR